LTPTYKIFRLHHNSTRFNLNAAFFNYYQTGQNDPGFRWLELALSLVSSGTPTFSLDILFGEVQQNTSGFKAGGQKLYFTGEYSLSESSGRKGEIYHLKSSKLPSPILLRKINDNLLHVLTTQQALMVGDAGWSYTLNRLNSITDTSPAIHSKLPDLPIGNGSDSVSDFVGRTLCSPALLALNGISATGCQRI